ncbi:hypothetical protein ACFSB1_00400 [Halopseudomonas phragmitis]|nr:hypothetical protein [Halopseudomonas phragmitis]
MIHKLGGAVLLGALILVGVNACSGDDEATAKVERQAITEAGTERKWYEGGTLHQANGLDWQTADYANKLATAGDLVATVYQSGKLNSELSRRITDPVEARRMSEELVKQLDDAFEPETDPDQNQKMYVNQKVSSTAAIVMALMGWLDLSD